MDGIDKSNVFEKWLGLCRSRLVRFVPHRTLRAAASQTYDLHFSVFGVKMSIDDKLRKSKWRFFLKWLWRGLLVFIVTAVVMLALMSYFITFQIHNARKESFTVMDINASSGVIFHNNTQFNSRTTEGAWGFVFSRGAELYFTLQSGDTTERLTCFIDRGGSDYCDVDIADGGISCDCYQ